MNAPKRVVDIDDSKILSSCILRIKNKVEKSELVARASDIEDSYLEYLNYAKTGEYHKIVDPLEGETKLIRSRMESMYKTHVLNRTSASKKIYDILLYEDTSLVCPSCLLREISTLDHYLPKKHYPSFAIYSYNLVPCCSRCNSIKKDVRPQYRKRFLHPYFDSLIKTEWLDISLQDDDPTQPSFSLNDSVPVHCKEEAEYHFSRLNLSLSYSLYAANDYIDNLLSFRYIYEHCGRSTLEENILAISAGTSKHGSRPWRAAYYKTLASLIPSWIDSLKSY